jgi:hypothetical protein
MSANSGIKTVFEQEFKQNWALARTTWFGSNQFVQVVLDRLDLRLSRRIGEALAQHIHGGVDSRPKQGRSQGTPHWEYCENTLELLRPKV